MHRRYPPSLLTPVPFIAAACTPHSSLALCHCYPPRIRSPILGAGGPGRPPLPVTRHPPVVEHASRHAAPPLLPQPPPRQLTLFPTPPYCVRAPSFSHTCTPAFFPLLTPTRCYNKNSSRPADRAEPFHECNDTAPSAPLVRLMAFHIASCHCSLDRRAGEMQRKMRLARATVPYTALHQHTHRAAQVRVHVH